tara:strand:- start:78124 stop:78531 length:408 start_codon:yes stop_codon:yes gene_type:complete
MKFFRNILAVLVGAVVGGAVNMALIMSSDTIIPLPEGVDPGDMNSLVENMHLFEPINFLMPFLAHALGTLVGAYLAAVIAVSNKMYFAIGIGVLFLVGGIQMAMDLPSPLWFNITDIVFAYLPMGWIGWKLAGGK